MRFPNPIGRRLDRVRETYAHRPEVFERTLQIAKNTAGKETIDPKKTEVWEEYLPWIASNISKLAKKRDKGQITEAAFEAEVKKLGTSFKDIVQPFVERKARGKGVKTKAKGRRVQLQQLTPKQAREHVKRVERERGFRVIKKLGGGYVAVVATPNLKAPRFPSGRAAQERWVAENAPFQQWLGVRMHNCLQFYRVNYAAFGAPKFENLRRGGKLYAILNKKGEPVAATLTDSDGSVIETNGRNNLAPRGEDAKALERFEKVMWGGKIDRGTFDVDTDPRLTGIIENLSDELEAYHMGARRKLIRQARRYARQNRFDGEAVFRAFMVYILVGSKYSALRSVRKTDYPKKKDIEKIIVSVATLISQNASREKLQAIRGVAKKAIGVHVKARIIARGRAVAVKRVTLSSAGMRRTAALIDLASAEKAAVAAYVAEKAVLSAEEAATASSVPAYTHAAVDTILFVRAAASEASVTADYNDLDARGYEAIANNEAILIDYADGLLKIMRKQAERGRPQDNPAKRKSTKKKVTKKKVTRKKAPPYQLLINRCQKLWDHYCERPSKSRLKPVLEHLEKMKASTSKKVDAERARCLRVANKEARRLKMK